MVLCGTYLGASEPLLLDRLGTCRAGDWAIVRLDGDLLCWRFLPQGQRIWVYETALDAEACQPPSLYDSQVRWSRLCVTRSKEERSQDQVIALLFQQLLDLTWEPVSLEKQRRRGPAPRNGMPDQRSVWRPTLARQDPDCAVVQASWPPDDSELAGSQLTAYLPSLTDPHLGYIPYYVEIERLGVRRSLELLSSAKAPPPAPSKTIDGA